MVNKSLWATWKPITSSTAQNWTARASWANNVTTKVFCTQMASWGCGELSGIQKQWQLTKQFAEGIKRTTVKWWSKGRPSNATPAQQFLPFMSLLSQHYPRCSVTVALLKKNECIFRLERYKLNSRHLLFRACHFKGSRALIHSRLSQASIDMALPEFRIFLFLGDF